MAQNDRTDMPDENADFYVDDFGESLSRDEALPEQGEVPTTNDASLDDLNGVPFYEQSPDNLLDDSYVDPADELNINDTSRTSVLDQPVDPTVFDEDQEA